MSVGFNPPPLYQARDPPTLFSLQTPTTNDSNFTSSTSASGCFLYHESATFGEKIWDAIRDSTKVNCPRILRADTAALAVYQAQNASTLQGYLTFKKMHPPRTLP